MEQTPEGEIVVEEFTRYLAEKRSRHTGSHPTLAMDAKALIEIPRNRAITTHAVHVYANLINFNSVLVEAGRETEASHRRALEFLHAHYRACDNLIDEFAMLRVDFHGSRLHAVVLAPEGASNEGERVRIAVSFAAAFRAMVARLSNDHPEFQTEVRIGIDTGPAVAIDGGKSDEREPLFIGSPANHAAKLAAGEIPGIILSPRAETLIGQQRQIGSQSHPLSAQIEQHFLTEEILALDSVAPSGGRLETAYQRFSDEFGAPRSMAADSKQPAFSFHYKQPPLKNIVFKDHPPSNAIRMELASIFADLDGFTAYIDAAMRDGKIAEAVANLHVLRAEMAAVLRNDFSGRKVRFVGDCVHGLIAEGTSSETDPAETVRSAVIMAGALRSSFDLCRTMLPGIRDMGLAIGIDYGTTPICRLGLRGLASVRTAASRSACISEAEQQRCSGNETAIGEAAYRAASAVVREAFKTDRALANLDYLSAQFMLGLETKGAAKPAAPMQAHVPASMPLRAHAT
ncbi:adenylate/guanylate cyclase domain-containing protein [Novosphingobium lindaniclasticum]|nr:adenylate/guanylate cyclase domain-containing protein [Novosphingobium lindaniclasticum]